MKHQNTVVRVNRTRGLGRERSAITVERDGRMTEYTSVDELPRERCGLVDEFITSKDDSPGFDSQAFDNFGMRRQTSLHDQDGSLVLEYRWFDG